MSNSNLVAFRLRKKDKELKEFLESLDPSVDISDAVRTCALYGARHIGEMFPKKLNNGDTVDIVDSAPLPKKDKPKVEETREREEVGTIDTTIPEPTTKIPSFKKINRETTDEDIETLGDNLLSSLL